MVMPKNAPDKEAAYKYMNALLEPSAQQGFAAHMGYLPTVDNAPLSGRVGEQLSFPRTEAEAGDAGLSGAVQGAAGPERLVAEEHPARLTVMTTARRRESAAATLLGPASLLMVLMLVAPLALLFRDSLNRYDPTELMIAAVTPAQLPAFLRRSVLLGRAGHHHPRLRHRHRALPAARPADGLAPGAHRRAGGSRRWSC